MEGKSPKGIGSRKGIMRLYGTTLVGVASWKVALALVLALCVSVTQGAQLLLLVPLMSLAGLDVQQGSVGWLNELVSSIFAAVGVRPSTVTVLSAFALFTIALAALTRWRTAYSFRLQEDFASSLRRRLYRAIANVDWLVFTRSRSSDFTHALPPSSTGSVPPPPCPWPDDRRDPGAGLYAARPAVGRGDDRGRVPLRCRPFAGAQEEDAVGPMDRRTGLAATNGLYAAAIEHLGGMKTVRATSGGAQLATSSPTWPCGLPGYASIRFATRPTRVSGSAPAR